MPLTAGRRRRLPRGQRSTALPLPASVTLQAVLVPGGKEQRFDFTFTEFSVDAVPPAMDVATRLMMDVPDDPKGLVAMLVERRDSCCRRSWRAAA